MRRAATITAVLLAAAAAASVTGCSTISALNPPVQADYTSWSEAQHTANPSTSPPGFVPHDATSLYVRVRSADGAAILTYTSPTPPTGCTHGVLTGKPALDSNWWPVAAPPAEGTVCPSGWRLYELDGVTYGWRPGQNN